jgi:hypothetical protein
MMTNDRFKELLDAYGADPARWPQSEREAALAFAKSSDEARRLLDEAAALDRLIDLADTAAVTPALQARILAAFPQPRRAGVIASLMPGRPTWIPITALAASLLLGLGVGTFVPTLAGIGDPQGQDAALVALGDLNDLGLLDETGEGS